jgi:hypothetical protein
LILEGPQRAAALAASSAVAVILRLRLNKVELQRCKQMLALCQRQSVNRGAYSATAARPPTS